MVLVDMPQVGGGRPLVTVPHVHVELLSLQVLHVPGGREKKQGIKC